MSLLSKFVDSLHVHYVRSGFRENISPVAFSGRVEPHNVLIQLNRGTMLVGEDRQLLQENAFHLFPAGHPIFSRSGKGQHHDLGSKGFEQDEDRWKFFRAVHATEEKEDISELFTVVIFDVLLYDAIPFFEVLELSGFTIPYDEEFAFLVKHIALESELQKLGYQKIIGNYMEELMIHLCRYMESQPYFDKYIERLEFLTDRRLVDIVKYIQTNIDKDLSNKTIAQIAFVSEDYVGQFFKSLTGKNLQDYIENQRLDKAMKLLRSEPDNIQEIAHRVGFKDPAYFSRRFKMKFGSNANAIRQHRNQLA